ncbi:EmrB/QacA subfamily drug resistance transporter [Terracoccus luteus]|uniref:EmrB/QacA subfamily drug resistance transporter n=2 Tax=Terracoccus luteus TaxID=53356 RepID=A0A495Y410_9MICO|nr:EmrB/QacA subfamily drug resistance transporter [Terracoccus luteus]
MSTTTTETGAGVGFRSERGPVLIALMLATALIALDSTILATAVPTIVDELGGLTQFPWLFSVYLLAQAVSVPVYSKLADTVGRKPVMLIGIALFLAGSLLCGIAWDMGSLIIMRAVQGLGAGAVLPVSITIAGDIYTVAERAKAQGYIASVWAVSSVVGPSLGGVFSQFTSWRWIFFVNVPLCLVAAWMLSRSYHEKVERVRHRIDYAGAVTLTLSLTLLILAVLEGGQAWAWASWQSIGGFAVGVALLVAFVLIERRAAEPILPLAIFSRRLIVTTLLISLGVGVVLIGLTSYVPTFVERSLGVQPVVAGLAVAALTLGWPLAASQSGRLYLRVGFRPTAVIGLVVAAVGAALLWLTSSGSASIPAVAVSCFVVGLGLGLVAAPTLIAAQASVPWNERAVITGANMFMRSVGSAVGVAIFGAVANNVIAGQSDPKRGIELGSHAVFLAVVVAAVLSIVAGVLMPNTKVSDVEDTPSASDDSETDDREQGVPTGQDAGRPGGRSASSVVGTAAPADRFDA